MRSSLAEWAVRLAPVSTCRWRSNGAVLFAGCGEPRIPQPQLDKLNFNLGQSWCFGLHTVGGYSPWISSASTVHRDTAACIN